MAFSLTMTDCTSTRTYDTAGHSMTQTKPEGHHTHETPQVRGTDTCGNIAKIAETDRKMCMSEERPQRRVMEGGHANGDSSRG